MKKNYITHFFCNFCGSKKRRKLFNFDKQNLVLCKECRLIFLDKQRCDFENLYNEDYYSSSEDNTKANYADYQTQEKTIEKDFSFAYTLMRKNHPKGKLLLEIGPGYGYFLKHLPKAISYEAVEVSKEAVRHIRKQKIKVYEGDFLKIPFKKKYDYILAFDVIEHQIYLKEFLEKLYKSLKPNGLFIFTTPDYTSIFNRIFGRNAPTIQPLYHNYYLNQKWLKANAPLIGFEVKYIKTVHITYLSVGQIVLMASFAIPSLRKLSLNTIARRFKVDSIIIPFIRFGGIECILKKV